MDTEHLNPPSPPAPPRGLTWVAGIIMGDVVAGVLFGIGAFLYSKYGRLGFLGVPSFFLVPAFGGLTSSYFWRSLRPGIGVTCLNTLWMTLVALVIGSIAFREGAICLLILSPVFYVSALAGALVGRVFFKPYPPRLNVSLAPVLLLAVLAEPLTRAPHEGVVTDEILIQAPPSRVWPQVTSFPNIPSPAGFWLFRLGLPYPVATTSSGDFVDADRRCIFSHDAVFKERVSEIIPSQKLTFEIVESPPDPELVGHLTPHRGQFVLRDNADGSTTLVGSSWYSLHVRPLWYFDFWTHHIFRAVHLRVMEDIRRRAEAAP
jgi:hypothetical protein